jgi:hypothetical protein
LIFGNVSALFRLVLKVYYGFCQLLRFKSNHNEIRAASRREKSQAKGISHSKSQNSRMLQTSIASSNKSRLVV